MRRISILGATGSIGQNTLDLIRRARDQYQVVALTGGKNIDRLAADAREFQAEMAVVADPGDLADLKERLAGSGVRAGAGPQALCDAAGLCADWVMSAIVGAAGLAPGLQALQTGATLALANKESLVAAGPLVMATAREHGATILPVDSEHSAVFQALCGEDPATVENVTITASGGPFRDWPLAKLVTATVEQALNHPNWSMGNRITIDSASMFNKALEVIETKEFFGFDTDQIDVLVHPESRIHAVVTFCDGGAMAHLGAPDMRHAIGYALHWPERRHVPVARLDLGQIGQLNFSPPDLVRFPALRLARDVMKTGGLSGAMLNAAKEIALDGFIAGQIRFTDMAAVVEDVLTIMSSQRGHIDAAFTLDNVVAADHLARVRATEMITKRNAKV